jgi:serine/threonine protein kinase
LKKKEVDRIKALDIACQMTKALSAAHKAGIVHRDVKPENVIVTDDGLVKILDFGLAKYFSAKNGEANDNFDHLFDTNPGLIIGTISYMSPEQIRGKDFDWRTDIWSLGVVFYEMLAGARPFVGETQSEIRKRILLTEPDYSSEIEEIPEIKKILVKTLAKDLNLRYEKTTDLANDLENVYKFLSNGVHGSNHSFAAANTSSNGAHHTNEVSHYFANKAVNEDKIKDKKPENQKIERAAGLEKLHLNYKFLIAGIVLLIVIIVLVELLY